MDKKYYCCIGIFIILFIIVVGNALSDDSTDDSTNSKTTKNKVVSEESLGIHVMNGTIVYREEYGINRDYLIKIKDKIYFLGPGYGECHDEFYVGDKVVMNGSISEMTYSVSDGEYKGEYKELDLNTWVENQKVYYQIQHFNPDEPVKFINNNVFK